MRTRTIFANVRGCAPFNHATMCDNKQQSSGDPAPLEENERDATNDTMGEMHR